MAAKPRRKQKLLPLLLLLGASIISLWLTTRLLYWHSIEKDSVEKYSILERIATSSPVQEGSGADDLETPLIGQNKHKTFYAFIRVQKSGSTSLLSFLGLESGLRPWNEFLYNQKGFYDSASSSIYQRYMPFCVYGHAKNENATVENDPINGPFHVQRNVQHRLCPHLKQVALEGYWNKSLQYLNPPMAANHTFDLSLKSFTMIRDPFERLRSMFYYVRNYCDKNQSWKSMFTAAQYDRVCAGDFEGWLEMIHKDRVRLGITNQYRNLDTTVKNAISRIQGDSPEVLVVLNECFEVSLRLLEKKFSLKPGATDAFLNSSHFRENVNNRAPKEGNETLRELAKEWFSDDYRFYNAAADQFRIEVAAAGIDLSSLQKPCPALTAKMGPTVQVVRSMTPLNHMSSSNTKTLLGFIRIRKTGSSSVLNFLTRASGLHSWDNFIYSATDYLQIAGTTTQKYSPFCVFGHSNTTFEHDPRDGPNPFDYAPEHVYNSCPHIPLSTMKKSWQKSLVFSNHTGPADNFHLQPVTMVRDPFDRLRSLFYYVRNCCNTTQAWKGMFTDAQYEKLCDGDLNGWIFLLHRDGKKLPVIGTAYQHEYLDNNVQKAISLIQGDSPKVYILLNECFEESLRFLEHKFSLKAGSADVYADSSWYRVNTNRAAPRKRTASEHKLREDVKLWFADDYKFYDAAVRQFQHQAASINLNPSSLRNPCHIWQQKNEGPREVFLQNVRPQQ